MDLSEIWYIYVFFHEEHDGANIEWLTVMVSLLFPLILEVLGPCQAPNTSAFLVI